MGVSGPSLLIESTDSILPGMTFTCVDKNENVQCT